MEQTKPLASLTPTLLARKGGARPAMRPQLAYMDDALARDFDNDLGWNDMGYDVPGDEPFAMSPRVVPLHGDAPAAPRRPRGSALRNGRKAAFTLRLDAERHLKLRLACTLDDSSAQALVTAALDRLLAEMPELSALADQVGKRRKS